MSKIIGNTVGMGLPKPNLMQNDPTKGDYVKGKEEFLAQAGAGSGQNPPVGGGLTSNQANLLEAAFEHIQWADAAGPQYAAQLIAALRSGESGGEEPEPEEPEQPAKTLTGISAVYTGGNVSVGTAVSGLTGISVTAHYSDGSTANVTGYTLSGTIAEGENTVTVTYMGKTTTITVTGEAQAPDGRTLLHNWVLNDQSGSSIDTVGGLEISNYYAQKYAEGWRIENDWSAIRAVSVVAPNRTVELDIVTDPAEDLDPASTLIVFGTGNSNWGGVLSLQCNNGTWRWRNADGVTDVDGLTGMDVLDGKTLAFCISSEGSVSLWADGEYISTAPGTITADSIYVGTNVDAYHYVTVSGIRVYEGGVL